MGPPPPSWAVSAFGVRRRRLHCREPSRRLFPGAGLEAPPGLLSGEGPGVFPEASASGWLRWSWSGSEKRPGVPCCAFDLEKSKPCASRKPRVPITRNTFFSYKEWIFSHLFGKQHSENFKIQLCPILWLFFLFCLFYGSLPTLKSHAAAPHSARPRASRRYWPGVTPVMRLKCRVRWL